MRTIAILAASTILAAVGGSTAAFAVTSAQADAGSGVRMQLAGAQPASFVRSAGRVVPVSAGDDHRSRHVVPGDDHGRHAEPGDDHGRHVEPGDDHGDDHGRHGHGHGNDGHGNDDHGNDDHGNDDHGRHGGHGSDD
jgi:hypothetical protein